MEFGRTYYTRNNRRFDYLAKKNKGITKKLITEIKENPEQDSLFKSKLDDLFMMLESNTNKMKILRKHIALKDKRRLEKRSVADGLVL